MTEDGRVHHLHVKFGDGTMLTSHACELLLTAPVPVANRVISVGDASRAEVFAQHFDDGRVHIVRSSRLLTTYTGRYKGVRAELLTEGVFRL